MCRLTAEQKAGLLGLVDDAQAAGWPLARCCEVVGVSRRRVQRWRLRRVEGTLEDRRPGGNPLHRILPAEEAAVLELIEEWGKVDRSHRKLAHRGSYLHLVWVSPSTVRRIVRKHGLSLPKEYRPKPPPNRVWPDSITWEPNKIWIWDSRTFTKANRYVVVIMDVVSRKWIEHIVTPEFTMTQTQVLFMRALEAEGLLSTSTRCSMMPPAPISPAGNRCCWPGRTTARR